MGETVRIKRYNESELTVNYGVVNVLHDPFDEEGDIPRQLWEHYVRTKNLLGALEKEMDEIIDEGGDKDGNQRTRPDTREVNNVFEQAEGRETS